MNGSMNAIQSGRSVRNNAGARMTIEFDLSSSAVFTCQNTVSDARQTNSLEHSDFSSFRPRSSEWSSERGVNRLDQ